jgi:spore coat protein U-like protein
MKLKCIQLLAAMLLSWPVVGAQAAITCNISSPGFTTSYDPAATSQTIVQTSLTVTCQRNLAGDPTTLNYSIGADNGLYAGGGSNRARLVTNYVRYDVYRDSLCSSQWRMTSADRLPDPPPGTMTLSGFVPTTVDISYWGCIPALQGGATAGIHIDTVTLRLFRGTTWTIIASATFPVAIHVSATCSISTAPGNITFAYTSFGPAVNASTNFGATCTNLLPYTLALDSTSGTLLGMNYSLALGASSSTGNGVEQTHTISGTMAAGQAGTCPAGTCSASQAHTLVITY